MPSDLYYKRPSRWLLAIFLVTAVSITAAGYYAYSQMREEAELSVRTQLLNAVDMKLGELQAWTDERYADASMVAADVPLLNAIHAVIQAKASPAKKQEVTQWVEGLCRKGRYANAFLFDPNANIVLLFGNPFGDPSHFKELVDQSMGANLAVLRDLHVDSKSGVLHL